MLYIFITLLSLLAAAVASRPHYVVDSAILERKIQVPPSPDCNSTCAPFSALRDCHGVPHCGCSRKYLRAQGDCLVCLTSTPQGAAAIQFFLDDEMNECHKHGIPIQVRLRLPPKAQAIVDQFDHESARLRQQQTAFLALHIAGGHVGLVVILAFAIFSRRVYRDPTFLNFCVTWIFSSIVYSLLLYRGMPENTTENSLGSVSLNTCLLQAALINGAQIMTASSTMALVIHLWIGLRATIHGDHSYGPTQRRWTMFTLLVLPYVLFLVFAIPSIFVGKTQITIGGISMQQAFPANFYCSIIQLDPFLRAVYGVTLVLLIVTAGFDALIIVMLYRHWWSFRRSNRKNGGVSLCMLLRVIVFSVYRVAVAAAYWTVIDTTPRIGFLRSADGEALSISSSAPIWVDMLQATIPLVGFLVLGVNAEILASFMFWRRDRKPVCSEV